MQICFIAKNRRVQWSKVMLGHFCFALEKRGHICVFCTVRLDIQADVKGNNTSWSSMANTLFEKKDAYSVTKNYELSHSMIWTTDYGRPMKPFFIEIQNFCAWADSGAFGVFSIYGLTISPHFGTVSPLFMFINI